MSPELWLHRRAKLHELELTFLFLQFACFLLTDPNLLDALSRLVADLLNFTSE